MSYAQITIDGRRALLDALVALRAHRDALILVGAQAIYLYTGDYDVAIVTVTRDSDLVVDPHRLVPDPLLQDAMTSAGFTSMTATFRAVFPRFTRDRNGQQAVLLGRRRQERHEFLGLKQAALGFRAAHSICREQRAEEEDQRTTLGRRR